MGIIVSLLVASQVLFADATGWMSHLHITNGDHVPLLGGHRRAGGDRPGHGAGRLAHRQDDGDEDHEAHAVRRLLRRDRRRRHDHDRLRAGRAGEHHPHDHRRDRGRRGRPPGRRGALGRRPPDRLGLGAHHSRSAPPSPRSPTRSCHDDARRGRSPHHSGRARSRTAARALLLHAAHPFARRAAGEPLPPDQGDRRTLPLAGAGGRRRSGAPTPSTGAAATFSRRSFAIWVRCWCRARRPSRCCASTWPRAPVPPRAASSTSISTISSAASWARSRTWATW